MPSLSSKRSDRRDRPADRRDQAQVATNFARPLARALRAHGLDPAAILGDLGGPELPARVPFAVASKAWQSARHATGDAAIGLVASTCLVAGDFGLLEFLALSSPTLGAAIDRLDRYHRLVNDRAVVRLEREGDRARLRYVWPDAFEMPRAYVEFVLGSWVRVARETFDADRGLLGAAFPFPAPEDPALHRTLFGDDLRFDAAHADLYLSVDVLDRHSAGGDDALGGALEQHASSVLAERSTTTPWSARVAEEIRIRLSDGTPRLADVARGLGIAERALRRRLDEEGDCFAKILDAVRCRLATAWVEDPSLSLGEIAFLLGFSEASAFHRAFGRWTGRTPRDGRRPSSLRPPPTSRQL